MARCIALIWALDGLLVMNKHIPLIIGTLDGALFFLAIFVVVAIGVFNLDSPSSLALLLQNLLTRFWWEVLFILLPLSVFVGWRGMADGRRILLGRASLVRPTAEGFFLPFISFTVLNLVAALNVAFAAGGTYDGAKEWGFIEWIQFTFVILVISAFIGGAGIWCALALHTLNRFLIKRLARIPAA